MLKVLGASILTLVMLLPFLLLFAGFIAFAVWVFRTRLKTRGELKRIYGYSGEVPPECIWFSCRATSGRERISTSLASSKNGLFLLLSLRLFRNPEQLFVPWSELSFTDNKILWVTRKRLTLWQVPGFHLNFDPKVIARLEQERVNLNCNARNG